MKTLAQPVRWPLAAKVSLGLVALTLIAVPLTHAAAPAVTAVSGDVAATTLTVTFSTDVTASGLDTTNYLLVSLADNTTVAAVTGAAVGVNASTIVLSVPSLAAQYYTLRVRNVADTATATPMVTTNITCWGDALTQATAYPALPGVETVVTTIDFDQYPALTNSYTYGWGTDATFGFNMYPLFYGWYGPNFVITNADAGHSGKAQRYYLNYTEFAANPPIMAGSGSGAETAATSGGVGPGIFTSTNLSQFKYSFDARVAGLLPGTNSVAVSAQAMLLGPDKGGGNASDFQLNVTAGKYGFELTTNWQSFAFRFDDPSITVQLNTWTNNVYNPDPTNLFHVNFNQFSTFKVNFDTPLDLDKWGPDGDNYLFFTNLKLIHVDTSKVPALAIARSGANSVITWPAPHKLQSASSINGPFVDVFDAVGSTYTVPANGGPKYFRARAATP
jgi:hypothetical protein